MLAQPEALASGKRYRVISGRGAAVTADCDGTSAALHVLPHDTLVLAAETRVDDAGIQRLRISSPAGWMAAEQLEYAGPTPVLRLDAETFEAVHTQVAPGDHYGLEFPFTIDLLREHGAAFLTRAFRAAGTISADNSVTEIVSLNHLGIPGASENAFLTLAYERKEPGLETELFVKFPPADFHHKFALSASSQSEVEMLRFSRRGTVPVCMARYYFGDYSSRTSNYILITERLGFGVAPIEPAYRKGFDHLVPQVEEHYSILVKSLARLVAGHKAGRMGYDIESLFPFARAARDFLPIAEVERKADRLVDFIGRVAPHLFVPGASDSAFLAQWRDDLLFGLRHKDVVIIYLHADVDYTGFCHPNLNVDNAWYWRNGSGELHAGLIDWGGVGQMSIGQALSGMLMMLEPHRHKRVVDDTLSTFIAEYEAHGGLKLDRDKLLFHYKASLFSTALWTIVGMLADMLGQFTDEEYRSMKDPLDERLQANGMCVVIIWIDNMLREWLDELTPGDACRVIVAQAAGG